MKCKKTIERNSNIELLRIILMFFIIWGHAISQSERPETMELSNRVLDVCIGSFARPATLCFMIISAWFMNIKESAEKIWRKAVYLWIKVVISCLCINIFCCFVFKAPIKNLLYSLFPLTWRPLWFVACYIMFLLWVPFLNAALIKFDCKIKKMGATILFVLVYGIGTISPLLFWNEKEFPTFYSELLVFLVIYIFITTFKEWIEKIDIRFWTICFVCNIGIIIWGRALKFIPTLFGEMQLIREFVSYFFSHIETIPNFVFSLSIIMIIQKISIKSKMVNTISKCTLMVYILHQMPVLWPHLWDEIFGLNIYASKSVGIYAIYLFGMACIIYAVSFILDLFCGFITEYIAKRCSDLHLSTKFKRRGRQQD